jgi:hypothetical protein
MQCTACQTESASGKCCHSTLLFLLAFLLGFSADTFHTQHFMTAALLPNLLHIFRKVRQIASFANICSIACSQPPATAASAATNAAAAAAAAALAIHIEQQHLAGQA